MFTSGFAVRAEKMLPGTAPYSDGVIGDRMGDLFGFDCVDDILRVMVEGERQIRHRFRARYIPNG